jgi:hypothetical protein
VSVDELLTAIQDSGYSSQTLRQGMRLSMDGQKFYHVVVRGNDPKFMPLGVTNGQDVVTNYPLEQMELIREEVQKYLFDELGDAQAIQQAMSDPCFDKLLESYFRTGDTRSEEALHVVSRFNGGSNLLHACIKEGHLETLKLLLARYTFEGLKQEGRWRVLAEPLRGCGKYKCSAFHRAVFDGQQECLEELVAWAQKRGHNITELRNVEERNQVGEAVRGLTCLELAEQEGNFGCYNILAPLFGVPAKDIGLNTNLRAARLAIRMLPRVELAIDSDADPLKIIELPNTEWERVLDAVNVLMRSEECRYAAVDRLLVRVCNVAFLFDATEQHLDELLAATEGTRAVEASNCSMATDRTCIRCLRVVVSRLETNGNGHLPSRMPQKVHLASPSVEELSAEEEAIFDAEAGLLVSRFVELCGRWPGFLGARAGLVSKKQQLRLARNPDGGSFAASWAAVYATRVPSFLAYGRDVGEGSLENWLRTRELMPLVRAVSNHFYSTDRLLTSGFQHPVDAVDPAAVQFLMMTLLAWFALAPREAGVKDPWRAWAERLGADEEIVKQELAPALDVALESLLRMWKVLNPLCRNPRARATNATTVSELIKQVVPETLLCRLPMTQSRLQKYNGPRLSPAAQSTSKGFSLSSIPTSLRPDVRW